MSLFPLLTPANFDRNDAHTVLIDPTPRLMRIQVAARLPPAESRSPGYSSIWQSSLLRRERLWVRVPLSRLVGHYIPVARHNGVQRCSSGSVPTANSSVLFRMISPEEVIRLATQSEFEAAAKKRPSERSVREQALVDRGIRQGVSNVSNLDHGARRDEKIYGKR